MEISDITLIAFSSVLVVASATVIIMVKCRRRPVQPPQDWVTTTNII
jgi:heme/copper-type cytochrome/quinol oxidase subunit 2